MKKIIRYTGSPDSNPAQWLRINHLSEKPGPGSAYRVTIQEITPKKIRPATKPKKPKRYPFDIKRALAGETVIHVDGMKSNVTKHYPGNNPAFRVMVDFGGVRNFYYTESGRSYPDSLMPDIFMLNPPKKASK